MNKTLLNSLIIFVALQLAVVAHAQKLVVVFGLDETGSYSFRNRAVAIANGVISNLQPGDVFYARRITDKSYTDSCAIFRLEIPKIGDPPTNKFDRRARHVWKKKLKQVAMVKANAANFLSRLAPVKAKKTDIWGFFASVADRFRAEQGQNCLRMVIIASDMKDNCRRKTEIDLLGAEVIIPGFESGEDPTLTQKIKSGWTKSLEKFGAGSIVFLPPDCKLALNRQP